MDGGRAVELDPRKHLHLDHGYAMTSHSSQGQTADRVLIHVDTELGAKDLLNSRMAYVSCLAWRLRGFAQFRCQFIDRGHILVQSGSHLRQVLVDRLGHLKHVQFLTAKDRLQLIVGQDFSFVLWILKIVLLNVRPNLFCDFTSRQRFCANNFGQVL